MRKQERQVIENAIKTVNNMIERELEQEKADTEFCMAYLRSTRDDLMGYVSIKYRFAGMNEKDYDEFIDTVIEFKNLMYDKINNAKENERKYLRDNYPELINKIDSLIEICDYDLTSISKHNNWVKDYFKLQ